MTDRMIGLVSLIVGGLATIAACVQSFISWQARDDVRRSILLSQIVDRCSSVSPVRPIYELVFLTDKENGGEEAFWVLMREQERLTWLSLVARTIDASASNALEAALTELGEDLKTTSPEEKPDISKMTTALFKANVVVMGACDSLIAAKL